MELRVIRRIILWSRLLILNKRKKQLDHTLRLYAAMQWMRFMPLILHKNVLHEHASRSRSYRRMQW